MSKKDKMVPVKAPGPTKEQVAAKLAATMERHQMSQPVMARYLGVPLNTLTNWLRGDRMPGAGSMRLIEVLGMIEVLAPEIHSRLIER